jgi:hypothetical protein
MEQILRVIQIIKRKTKALKKCCECVHIKELHYIYRIFQNVNPKHIQINEERKNVVFIECYQMRTVDSSFPLEILSPFIASLRRTLLGTGSFVGIHEILLRIWQQSLKTTVAFSSTVWSFNVLSLKRKAKWPWILINDYYNELLREFLAIIKRVPR